MGTNQVDWKMEPCSSGGVVFGSVAAGGWKVGEVGGATWSGACASASVAVAGSGSLPTMYGFTLSETPRVITERAELAQSDTPP